jgi:hypothetical protein
MIFDASLLQRIKAKSFWNISSVVELEPQGTGTFGRSWSRNVEVLALAPGSGSA